MKILKLTDEQFAFLKSLSDQVKMENYALTPKHITAEPCFSVMEKEYIYGSEWEYFDIGWLGNEGEWVGNTEVFGYIKMLLKEGYEPENRKFDEIMTEFGFNRYSRKERDVFVGAYLTNQAAESHIKANYYHYEKPFVFVHSFWRNPEMQGLRELLSNLEFKN